MDEIERRLREVSDTCVKAYLDWQASKKDLGSREVLQDAIHELRKVSARLEIEIAVSEREEMQSRPIPIPPHRATRKGGVPEDDENSDSTGNLAESGGGGGSAAPRQVLRRRSQHHGGGRSHSSPGKSDD